MATGILITTGDRIVEELRRGEFDAITAAGVVQSVLQTLDDGTFLDKARALSVAHGVLQWLTQGYALKHNLFADSSIQRTRGELTLAAIELMYPKSGRDSDAS